MAELEREPRQTHSCRVLTPAEYSLWQTPPCASPRELLWFLVAKTNCKQLKIPVTLSWHRLLRSHIPHQANHTSTGPRESCLATVRSPALSTCPWTMKSPVYWCCWCWTWFFHVFFKAEFLLHQLLLPVTSKGHGGRQDELLLPALSLCKREGGAAPAAQCGCQHRSCLGQPRVPKVFYSPYFSTESHAAGPWHRTHCEC